MSDNTQTLVDPLARSRSVLADYFELTKPGVVWLIVMSTAVGFYLAASTPFPYLLMVHTLVATAILAGGTGALNQWLERELDAKMRRTADRPLPAGRLRPRGALWFGVFISALGVVYLAAAVNLWAAGLGLATELSYLFLYTPLKTKTPLSTFVGAFPGAAPPLIGWAAARGNLAMEGWALFAILFLWQFPHFYAIAWMYREDYRQADIRLLPVVEPDGLSTARQIVLCGLILVPVSLLPSLFGLTGWLYLGVALVLSLGYFYFGFLAARSRTNGQARRLLQASVVYLPLLYTVLVLDKL